MVLEVDDITMRRGTERARRQISRRISGSSRGNRVNVLFVAVVVVVVVVSLDTSGPRYLDAESRVNISRETSSWVLYMAPWGVSGIT